MAPSLSRLHQLLLDKGVPFVRYSMPNEDKAITQIAYNFKKLKHIKEASDCQQRGFLFAPFIQQETSPIWLLQADEYIDDSSSIEKLLDKLQAKTDVDRVGRIAPISTSKMEYSEAFESYLSHLKSTVLDKAILSKLVVKARKNIPLLDIFNQLAAIYPTAFTYLIALPTGEIWMGATPELLLRSNADGLETMALAGTQTIDDRELSEIVWYEKEVDEQAYVSKYVFEVLKTAAKEVVPSETYSSLAGKLVHLRTDFKVNKQFSLEEALRLAQKLHPTPAVCGIPLTKSRDIILKTEKHKRAYYTGFLGLIDAHSTTLFVNLRCMQVFPTAYALYVGGGITRDSEMEKEWQETEAKAQTLLSVIGSDS